MRSKLTYLNDTLFDSHTKIIVLCNGLSKIDGLPFHNKNIHHNDYGKSVI